MFTVDGYVDLQEIASQWLSDEFLNEVVHDELRGKEYRFAVIVLTYTPGEPATIGGDPDTSDPGSGDEFSLLYQPSFYAEAALCNLVSHLSPSLQLTEQVFTELRTGLNDYFSQWFEDVFPSAASVAYREFVGAWED